MDLLCFSHLRWNFVYQRPQHLMKRACKNFRVFYIEEPILSSEEDGYDLKASKEGVVIVTPKLKEDHPRPVTLRLESILSSLFIKAKIEKYIFWYYTPMMRELSEAFSPALIIYDCMDQLSAFKNASPLMEEAEQKLLSNADLVFTGGMSLYNAKKGLHHSVSCFPSSIDYNHFAAARKFVNDPSDQAHIPYPRLGFFGVIDERFDIELLRKSAEIRPDFNFVIIGPVVKIDPASLPQHKNIHYLGMKKYDELPAYISNWDIALLLFALNESTRFISPTKTPEYLAAGLPVISTGIEDVISTYGDIGLATIIEDAPGLVEAAQNFLNSADDKLRLQEVDDFLTTVSWDNTWNKMNEKMLKSLNQKSKKVLTHV